MRVASAAGAPRRRRSGIVRAVAGQGEDGRRADPDAVERPVAVVAEGPPLVDGEACAGGEAWSRRGGEPRHAPMVRGRESRAAAPQSTVIVTPEPSSSVTSMIGPRMPVRSASRTRST